MSHISCSSKSCKPPIATIYEFFLLLKFYRKQQYKIYRKRLFFKNAQGHPMLVELKNGETFNGHLVNCDNWMNLTLREVIQTSPEGDRFWRLPECYIRGNTIKYLRVPDEIMEMVKEDTLRQRPGPSSGNRGRGSRGGNTGGSRAGSSSGRGGGSGGGGGRGKSKNR
ncbi:unnamed protein product [Rhizophagus irregularis]|uniref:LSM complex subunit LSM4 n=1 Tax=Rhizophagus irregularis TaxID=588596 RepID=A0A916DYX8_9GLOM|nr:unnamed protein product [Rhizophagus irregularis]CAB5172511.1 unnamed protein product [Rhizophagus irregularis]CAB5310439.1 unnamed protein product [Rhizophagus irregularis]